MLSGSLGQTISLSLQFSPTILAETCLRVKGNQFQRLLNPNYPQNPTGMYLASSISTGKLTIN
jgi:hypothetical protein